MQIRIDRELPVPIPLQLQGQIEYGVSNGDFPPGSRLPSVRELAAQVGVSPVTVANVYGRLKEAGLIDSGPGKGTFVRERSDARQRRQIDPIERVLRQTLQRSDRAGISRSELIERVQRLATHRGPGPSLRSAFVGVYPHVTQAYVADLRRHLSTHDELTATTFKAVEIEPKILDGLDILFTFAHRAMDLQRIAPEGVHVETVNLIPSERTRVALAEIDPLSNVVLVSALPEFVVTFRRAVERFASHVVSIQASVQDSQEMVSLVANADVVVYATGAERVVDGLDGNVRAFEYRHVPDPIYVETALVPRIEQIRNSRTNEPSIKEDE